MISSISNKLYTDQLEELLPVIGAGCANLCQTLHSQPSAPRLAEILGKRQSALC